MNGATPHAGPETACHGPAKHRRGATLAAPSAPAQTALYRVVIAALDWSTVSPGPGSTLEFARASIRLRRAAWRYGRIMRLEADAAASTLRR